MRILFVLLVLSSVSYGQYSGINCEDVDGFEVDEHEVVDYDELPELPDDYTGVAFVCKEGGVKVLANYRDGKRVGIERWWHENGQLWFERNFKDGKIIDDKVVYYDDEGVIFRTKYYEDGKVVRCEGCDF